MVEEPEDVESRIETTTENTRLMLSDRVTVNRQRHSTHRYSTRSTTMLSAEDNHCCPRCGKEYRCRGFLLRHVKFECGKKAKMQCPYCPRRFNLDSSLNRHILMIHIRKKGRKRTN